MTYEEVMRLFVYEPDTGRLRRTEGRKPYPWHGCGSKRQYLATSAGSKNGRKEYAHRLVWLYHHGFMPKMVDHIDGDTKNNRIENLRECNNAQNQYNGRRKSNNHSGYKGVAFCKGYRKPWRARIVVDKNPIDLGYFNTPELAAAAYAEGAKTYAKEFAKYDAIQL